MSDIPGDLRICPNCGQENSLYTLRCIRCGEELAELFELEGFQNSDTNPVDETEADQVPSAEILASLDDSPLLIDPDADLYDPIEQEPHSDDETSEDEKDLPDWLERVRQRAQEEEDAAGELAKGALAMDERRLTGERGKVDEAFEEIMQRIREQKEREKARKPRTTEPGLVDENGDPEWLRRIRELHPKHEEDTRETVVSSLSAEDEDQWTEEELQELLRREMGLPEEPDASPEEITTEIETPEKNEPLPAPEPPVDFHNIPEDEYEIPDAETEGGSVEPVMLDEEPAEDPDLAADEPDEPAEPSDNVENEIGNDDSSEDEQPVEPDDQEPAVDPLEKKPITTEDVLPDLLHLRNQRERAQILREIIGQEGNRTIALLREAPRQGMIGRLVLGLLLVLGVLGAILLVPGGTGVGNLPLPAGAIAFEENLYSIKAGEKVLIVLDYHAATRADIEPLADEMFGILESKGVKPQIVTSNPENLWLGENLPDEFIPGGMLGYLSLAVSSHPDWGGLPISQVFADDARIYYEVDHAILISDSADFVRTWMEQVSPWQRSIKTSVITTSVSEAMLLPYFESGQLRGVVAGAAQSHALTEDSSITINQRAWQIGTSLMMVVLILGMVMKLDEDAQKRAEGRRR